MEHSQPMPSAPWRRKLLLFLVVVVGASVAARVVLASRAKAQSTPSQTRIQPHGILPGEPQAQEPQQTPPSKTEQRAQEVLPFITEGGTAMILGLALGMATRAFLRLGLLVLALLFVLLQVLAYKGILVVDWGAFGHAVKSFVLNVSSESGLGGIIRHKLPTTGAFFLGYVFGMRR